MNFNSNKIKKHSKNNLTNVNYKSVKGIFYTMIILNGLLVLTFNPLSAKVFLKPDGELSQGTQFALSLGCLFLILMILLYAYNISLWNLGHHRIPEMVANISVSVLAIGLLFLVFECMFRLFFSDRLMKNIYSYNKTFGMNYTNANLDVRLITSEYNISFRTNSIGLRGTRELGEKAENEKRILVVGDSFIQAAQVDIQDTMSSRLEEMLNNNRDCSVRFTVINVSMSGWAQCHERQYLEKNWQRFAPDYILLFIYPGNDVCETMMQTGNYLGDPSSKGIIQKIDYFILSYQNPFKILRYLGERLKAKREWPMGRPNQPFYDPHFRNGEANVFRKKYSKEINSAYQIIETEILKMRNLCTAKRSKFLLFVVPTKEQVNESKLRETVKFLKLDMNQLDLGKPQRILREFAIRNKIKVNDLLDALQEAEKIQPVYYELDSHWNKLGNLIVATEVFKYLQTNEKAWLYD